MIEHDRDVPLRRGADGFTGEADWSAEEQRSTPSPRPTLLAGRTAQQVDERGARPVRDDKPKGKITSAAEARALINSSAARQRLQAAYALIEEEIECGLVVGETTFEVELEANIVQITLTDIVQIADEYRKAGWSVENEAGVLTFSLP